jgi:hypothetical protein
MVLESLNIATSNWLATAVRQPCLALPWPSLGLTQRMCVALNQEYCGKNALS